MENSTIVVGDAVKMLRKLPVGFADCCITSPPYFGLRSYGVDRQIGLEATPEEYVGRLVGVFREVRRALRGDGTLWVVIGDSYACSGKGGQSGHMRSKNWQPKYPHVQAKYSDGCKPKDLIGIPWMLAFALRRDGWYLRQDIIWQKGNALPESVKDRCTRSHETIFMLSKSPRYYYDADAIKEPAVNGDGNKPRGSKGQAKPNSGRRGEETEPCAPVTMRNKRDVWHVNTAPCREAHFATFPPKLVQPMVLAGSRPGGVVLDPFCGSGTTGVVAAQEGRRFVGIDLSEEYCEIAKRRLIHDGGVTHASAV